MSRIPRTGADGTWSVASEVRTLNAPEPHRVSLRNPHLCALDGPSMPVVTAAAYRTHSLREIQTEGPPSSVRR